MAVQQLPVETELVIYAGTTFRRTFRWLPDGVTGQDFTGWAATFLLGPPRGIAIRTLTTDVGGGITLDTDGTITLVMPVADTNLPVSSLFYVLDLTDPSTEVLRLLRGRCSIVVDVERAP